MMVCIACMELRAGWTAFQNVARPFWLDILQIRPDIRLNFRNYDLDSIINQMVASSICVLIVNKTFLHQEKNLPSFILFSKQENKRIIEDSVKYHRDI